MLGFRVWDSVDKRFVKYDEIIMSSDGVIGTIDYNRDFVYMEGDGPEINKYIPMQSTGVYDCDDKPIYEGDVLFIYYHGDCKTYKNEYILVESVKEFLMWYGQFVSYIKKISNDGNVYEQPYLVGRLKENE